MRQAIAESQAALSATVIVPVGTEPPISSAQTVAFPPPPQQAEAQARSGAESDPLATVNSQSLSEMQWPSQGWAEAGDSSQPSRPPASESGATAALPEQAALKETPSQAEAEARAAEEAAARQRAEAEARRRAEAEAVQRRRAEEESARQRAAEEAAARRRAEEEAARRREAEEATARARAIEEERLRREAEESARREAEGRAAAEEARRRAEQERIAQQPGQATQPPAPYPPPQGFTTQGQQQGASISGQQANAPPQPTQHGFPPPPSTPGWQSQPPVGQQSQQPNFQQQQSWPLMSPSAQQSQQFQVSAPDVGAPAKPKSSLMLYLLAGALVLFVVLGGGAIAFLLWPSETTPNTNVSPTPTTAASPAASPTAQGQTPPAMIEIPGGSFTMGRSGGPINESPPHRVTVAPFAIDRTEVTNAEYAQFVSETDHRAPSDWNGARPPAGQEQWPVRNVSYDDAETFAEWRSQRDGVSYRLPTEAEWEYAARGGEASHIFPWGPNWIDGRAAIGIAEPRPVGSFAQGASPFGVLDMIGNVWEWTSTEIEPYPGNTTWQPRDDERGHKVIRGGSYQSAVGDESGITATRRNYAPTSTKHITLGFRLVRPSS